MRDEDTLQSSYKNLSERILIVNLVLFIALPMLLSVFNYNLSQDVLILTGLASIFNVITYQRHATTYREGTFLKYLLCFSPYIALAVIAIIALGTPILGEIVVGKISYKSLDSTKEALLISASDSFKDAVVSQLKILSVSSMVLSLYFICDSIYIIRKISLYIIISTFVFCVFGFILQYCTVETNVSDINKLGENSFFTFMDARQWCVYVILVMAISSIGARYSMQRFDFFGFLLSRRFMILLMQAILLLSVYLVGIELYTLIAGVLMLMSVLMVLPSALPYKRNIGLRLEEDWKSSSASEASLVFAIYCIFALGLVALIYFSAKGVLVNGAMLSSLSAVEEAYIAQDIAPLLEARPLFGWGSASFSEIFAFSQGSDMGTSLWAYPNTDLNFARLEIGYVGIGLLFISPVVLLLSALIKGGLKLSVIPLGLAVLSVLAMSLCSTPLHSPLVVAIFAVALFSLLTLIRVEK